MEKTKNLLFIIFLTLCSVFAIVELCIRFDHYMNEKIYHQAVERDYYDMVRVR